MKGQPAAKHSLQQQNTVCSSKLPRGVQELCMHACLGHSLAVIGCCRRVKQTTERHQHVAHKPSATHLLHLLLVLHSRKHNSNSRQQELVRRHNVSFAVGATTIRVGTGSVSAMHSTTMPL
jgi:hypothetical protein